MPMDTVERTLRLIHDGYDSARFIWHGGEPLLAGERFFHHAIGAERKIYDKSLSRCGNTIQTNGTLLTHRFIEFCKDYRINLGVSYEGGFEEGLRPGMDVAKIDDTIRYMVEKNHMFLVSATIHAGNVAKMNDMYTKFRGLGASVSFTPVIRLGCGADNKDLALDADTYVEMSNAVFDRWIYDRTTTIPVLPFFQYVMTALDGSPNISDCPHASCLGDWLCVHPYGDLYPCGKACPTGYRLGNINEVKTIEEVFDSDGFANILRPSIERRKKCKDCPIFRYCNGGCTVDAAADGDAASPDGFACRVYKGTFSHIKTVVDSIVKNKPDLAQYNMFIRNAIVGKIINPQIYDLSVQ
jgi:uncharacterized protein